MPNGSDIVVTGGSAEVEFNTDIFPPESNAPGRKKFKNAGMKITRVEITGDITFDSGENPKGFQCVIKAHCD